MTSKDALLRLGVTVLDEVNHWYRESQTQPVGSVAWSYSKGAIEALNRMADHLSKAIQAEAMEDAGLPIPAEPTQLRVITGGRP